MILTQVKTLFKNSNRTQLLWSHQESLNISSLIWFHLLKIIAVHSRMTVSKAILKKEKLRLHLKSIKVEGFLKIGFPKTVEAI